MEKGFIDIGANLPSVIISADYAIKLNFTGGVVRGYKAVKAVTSQEAFDALTKVQDEALSMNLTIKIFDGYRPVKAVSYFGEWAQLSETNPEVKSLFYPKHSRRELFDLGYIAKRSSHSRGSALDLTLVNKETGMELDMGSRFDYFDDLSHTDHPSISDEQKANRLLLKNLMEKHGFKNFYKEWWHYSLITEPHPEQYFDFDID